MGEHGQCPFCHEWGEYMAQGRMKGYQEHESNLFLGQKYKENGMVFRYIQVIKRFELQMLCGEKGLEMLEAREVLEAVELARAYFEKGKKVQIDYHKHNQWSGQDFWDDCNLSGMSNICIKAGLIMPETFHNMKGTILQYSALKEYQEAVGEVNPFKYMEKYIQMPQIEILVKMDLIKIVEKMICYQFSVIHNEHAKRVDDFLGIRKERIKLLIRNKGDGELLRVLQMEKKLGQNWTEEQAMDLVEIEVNEQDIRVAVQYITIQKILNRVAKYAGCEYGTECSWARERLKQTARIYFDYLNMRQQRGYDLTNSVYQAPKSLMAAHNMMVEESNKEKQDERMKKVAEKYPMIRKNYRKLRKIYYFEDDRFLIRPAKSAEEIVREGRLLHHCVGGDSYLEKHNDEKTYILMLRFKQEPDMPYITVEISGKNTSPRIIQWYGEKDKKPDKENMQKWIDIYVTRLKCLQDGVFQEAAGETAQAAAMPVLAYA